MLNFLSFFFIETIWHPVMIGDVFRCSMFWAFSLLVLKRPLLFTGLSFDAQRFELFLYYRLDFYDTILRCKKFRCSMFWAFSLWMKLSFLSALAPEGFDAQFSELFLYDVVFNNYIYILSFRCSIFWAFSLWADRICKRLWILWFRCSIFWAFSL